MGKHGVSITYLNNREIYAPGNIVHGSVVVELKRPKKIKKVKVNAIGQAVIKLKTGEGKQLRNNEKYFHFTIDVYTGSDQELGIGQHSYPFQFQLKSALPTSFEGKNGHVRYSIEATVEYPGILGSKDKVMSAITVLDTVDLNALSSSRHAQKIHCEKKASGMCWWRKNAVTIDIMTEKTGFVPGEFIFVNGLIVNGRTRPIKSFKVEIMQQVTFFGRVKNSPPNSAVLTHDITKAVASWNMTNVIDGESADNWEHKQLMQIPPLISSGLKHCSVIDVQYYLRTVMVIPAGVSGSELTGRSGLITIGTMPLITAPVQQPNFTQSQPPANIPSLIASAPPMEFSPDPSAPPPPYDPGDSQFASVPLPSYEEAVTGGGELRTDADEVDNEEIQSPASLFTPQYAFFDYSQPPTNPAYNPESTAES